MDTQNSDGDPIVVGFTSKRPDTQIDRHPIYADEAGSRLFLEHARQVDDVNKLVQFDSRDVLDDVLVDSADVNAVVVNAHHFNR